MLIEMLTPDACPRCASAKAELTAHGHQVAEISPTIRDLMSRPDRDDLMAALAENDGKAPLMRLAGTDRWYFSAAEILREIARTETAEQTAGASR